MSTIHTNAVGPLLMAKQFSPLLLNGDGLVGVRSTDPSSQHCGIIANMSAKVGSITDNGIIHYCKVNLLKFSAQIYVLETSLKIHTHKSLNKATGTVLF